MMGNFTPRAQQVLALAKKEADRSITITWGPSTCSSGSSSSGMAVAVNVLQKMGLDLDTVRLEVEKQVGMGPETKTLGAIPYTPRVKKVLALAQKEAKALNHSYVGTEHILLGLLREGEASRRASSRPRRRHRADPQRGAEGAGPQFRPSGSRRRRARRRSRRRRCGSSGAT